METVQTNASSFYSKTHCSSRIIGAWTLVMGVNMPVMDSQLITVSEPKLTVLNQQVSEGTTPPTPASCELVSYKALSHLSGLSTESYFAEKQEEINREDS